MTITLSLFAEISRFAHRTKKEQVNFFLLGRSLFHSLPNAIAHQKTEALKVPGIWQEVSEQATNIPADQKRAWIERKVCLLLEEGAGLLDEAEWKAAGLDPNPDMGTLAPFQQVKLGNIIAKKKASILVRFFHQLENFPEATALLQEIQTLSEIEQTQAIRKWMHENPELLATKNLTEYDERSLAREELPDFFPEEVLLFPNIAPHYLGAILYVSQYTNIGLFRKAITDARAQKLPLDFFGIYFVSVCRNASLKALNILITCNRFQDTPPDSLGKGFEWSCCINCTEVFEALITCNRFQDIPPDSLEEGFTRACDYNHLDRVQALINCSRFQDIPLDSLRNGFWLACGKNRLEIVQAIMNCSRFQDIPPDSLEGSLEIACTKENLKVINVMMNRHLFQDPRVSLAEELKWGCDHNQLEIVKAFINCSRFSEISTGQLEKILRHPRTIDPQIKTLLQQQLNKRQQEEQKGS